MFTGIGVSAGIGIAQSLLWRDPLDYSTIPHLAKSAEEEVARFEAALATVIQNNETLAGETVRRIGSAEAAIFNVYATLLADEELKKPIRHMIIEKGLSAEYAVLTSFNHSAKQMGTLENAYLRQRAEDFHNLSDQLLQVLMDVPQHDASHLAQPTIVVAHSFGPGDIASLDLSRIAGLVCETGGYTSHTSIIARNLAIPAIIGIPFSEMQNANGQLLALDGETGELWQEPGPKEIAQLRIRSHAIAQRRQTAQQFRGIPSVTLDGRRVELAANIGRISELETVMASDAEAVGLLRAELIRPGQPGQATEEEQFAIYQTALKTLGDKALTIRTMDISNHRAAQRGSFVPNNPALGFRGIRMSLGRPSVFRAQLRAILRASAFGNLKIMFPMVNSLHELAEAKAALEKIKEELRREGTPFDEKIPVGLLVEVPSAALLANSFAKQVDFFSIGLNDLMQFTLAADRGNPQLTHMLNPLHPAVLQLVHRTVQAAHANKIPCNVCGDFPRQDIMLPLYLGLGLDGFSLGIQATLPARQTINSSNFSATEKLAQEALLMDSAAAVQALMAPSE